MWIHFCFIYLQRETDSPSSQIPQNKQTLQIQNTNHLYLYNKSELI